jgi:hypothetical protein
VLATRGAVSRIAAARPVAREETLALARKKQPFSEDFVVVNVLYEDGSQRSNRRVPRSELSGFDDDNEIKAAIEAQDRKIAELSGLAPSRVKTIERASR